MTRVSGLVFSGKCNYISLLFSMGISTVLGFDQIGCACWIVGKDFPILLDGGEFPFLFET